MTLPRTQAEVDAHNARVAAGKASKWPRRLPRVGLPQADEADVGIDRPPNAPGPKREADLHEQIREECARRGWPAMHGSMAQRAFRTLGEPDFVIAADHGITYWVECKTRTGKLTAVQAEMIAWLTKLGHRVGVVRSFEEFLAFVAPIGSHEPEHRRD